MNIPKTFYRYEIDSDGVIGHNDGDVAFVLNEDDPDSSREIVDQANLVFGMAVMVKKHEYSATRIKGPDKAVSCCPECRGINPLDICRDHFDKSTWGHDKNCKWAALITVKS